MSSINDKTVLITGASSGIGEASVRRFLEKGAVVYAAARRLERMAALEKLGARLIRMDISDGESIAAAVGEILAERPSVDILVNNAGYGSFGAIEDVPLDEAKRQFEVNIFGLARLTQLVLPHMRRNRYGKIVNISSMGGKVYTPFGGWYHATKHALEGLTDCLRLELKGSGVDPVIIEPGGIKTDWGIIAAENLRKTSEGGAYEKAAFAAADGMERMYSGTMLTDADVIAKTIIRSVSAVRPKTRYAVGYMAKPAIFVRKLLGDRAYDAIIGKMM